MTNVKKYFILALINIILIGATLFACEFIARKIISDKQRQMFSQADFIDEKQYDFYRYYTDRLNHLRGFDLVAELPGGANIPENFIFTKIGNAGEKILIQGDSWSDQMLRYPRSRQALESNAAKNHRQFIVAGTSSYSPSPMAAQFEILRKDFQINPSYVIATIDQTDIGDELFRYKKQISNNANGDLIIKPFDKPTDPYYLGDEAKKLSILYGRQWALSKLTRLQLLKYQAEDNQRLIDHGRWENIAKPLREGLSKDDRDYVENRINEYIQTVLKNGSVKKLLIVTHFHRLQLTGEYQLNVSALVKSVTQKSPYKDRIILLDFEPSHYKEHELTSLFVPGDVASHLNEKYHALYMQDILNQLDHQDR